MYWIDILIGIILLIALFLIWNKINNSNEDVYADQFRQISEDLRRFQDALDRNEKIIRDEFQRNRSENAERELANRTELAENLRHFSANFSTGVKDIQESIRQKFGDFANEQVRRHEDQLKQIKEVRETVDKNLQTIREDNTKQLDEMRKTVDEKLQKTLNERLSQSFETVGKQLQAVQEGLGEMKTLATDVGGLKKVLSNVKMRGSFGEIQLSMLLEQILAPEQYEANVATKAGSSDRVEFAIRLPGPDDHHNLFLPIDAKFPKERYEYLQDAYEKGDVDLIASAQKQLEATITSMAKDIGTKYLDPPNTTDFGIMFLPFEGLYAEVVRKAALLEDLRRKYKVVVTGPSTLAAMLNSLQMGFKTLAIQKRSSEVWQVLGAVKKEFENFEGLMGKAQKNIQTGLNQLDEVMGKRTRAIQRKLKGVEALSDAETAKILPELSEEEGENS
ncbi:MAG: DNA recombination protein RmuC [Bacteroidetes bacterium]|nr:DNA recombination protein RmuC [Bacteroidota bacterium]